MSHHTTRLLDIEDFFICRTILSFLASPLLLIGAAAIVAV